MQLIFVSPIILLIYNPLISWIYGMTASCSLQNWIEDLYWKQLDINYPGMDDAMVRVLEKVSLFSLVFLNIK